MADTKYCNKIGCDLKPINRTTKIINAFCEFNGSRSDLNSKSS